MWNQHWLSKLKTLKSNSISSNNQMKSPFTTKTCFNRCDLRDSKEKEKKGIKIHLILKVCKILDWDLRMMV
jgi:hypothetical protein